MNISLVIAVILLPFVMIAFIGGMVYVLIRFTIGSLSGSQRERQEEIRVMQEIYGSLSKMEARIETLETLLLEREESKA